MNLCLMGFRIFLNTGLIVIYLDPGDTILFTLVLLRFTYPDPGGGYRYYTNHPGLIKIHIS